MERFYIVLSNDRGLLYKRRGLLTRLVEANIMCQIDNKEDILSGFWSMQNILSVSNNNIDESFLIKSLFFTSNLFRVLIS